MSNEPIRLAPFLLAAGAVVLAWVGGYGAGERSVEPVTETEYITLEPEVVTETETVTITPELPESCTYVIELTGQFTTELGKGTGHAGAMSLAAQEVQQLAQDGEAELMTEYIQSLRDNSDALGSTSVRATDIMRTIEGAVDRCARDAD